MHWLSETCVLLSCSDLVNSNYESYQAAAGEFSVLKPYQALAAQSGTSTPAEVSPSSEEVSGTQHGSASTSSHKRAAAQRDQQAQGDTLGEAIPEQHSSRLHKRRKKGLPDSQAKTRQDEAQQRHILCQPTLLTACHLLQQHLQKADSNNTILQPRQATISSQSTCSPAVPNRNTETITTLDLVSLHELKYTLRPKFAFLTDSGSDRTPSAINLFDTLICNEDSTDKLGDAYWHTVLVPALSTFLLSDIKRLNPLLPG